MKKRLFLGALAGALGGLAMKAVVRFVDRDSFGLSAETDAKTAHEIWRRMDWPSLQEKRAGQIGAAMHYAFAVLAGAVYSAGADKYPVIRTGRGAAFGAALFCIGDEMAVSVSGLENPFLTPLISHGSALSAHVVYGMIVDSVRSRLSQS